MHLKTFCIAALLVTVGLMAGCGPGGEAQELSTMLQEGWGAYSTGDFDFALANFARVDGHPDATEREKYSALLGLATVHHLSTDSDLDQARTYYSRLDGLQVPGARRLSLLGLGQIALAQGKVEAGRGHLEALRGEFPDSVTADEATLHLADSYFSPRENTGLPGKFAPPAQEEITKGLDLLEEWLRARPDNSLAAVMHMMLGDKYTDRSEFRKAVDHLQNALDKGIVSARTRSALIWQIARIAENELGDLELARHHYQRFVETSRRHVLYYRASQSLERVKKALEERAAE